VKVFLLGKGVECESITPEKFDVGEQLRVFVGAGGQVLACGTCLEARQSEGSDLCPISTLKDLHDIIRESEKLLTF
jgi:uncharacterized protein involved in oxidation of intracellular sulfur